MQDLEESALAAEVMAVPNRYAQIPGTYFVTSSTWQKRALFQETRYCEIFIQALFRYRQSGSYWLHSFVLMPNHFHLLLTPCAGVSLERAVQHVKGGSSRAVGIEARRSFPVWQRGFSDHRVRDLNDYRIHLAYVEMNPVRRGLAASPVEFCWGSACGQYELDAAPQRLKPRDAQMFRHG